MTTSATDAPSAANTSRSSVDSRLFPPLRCRATVAVFQPTAAFAAVSVAQAVLRRSSGGGRKSCLRLRSPETTFDMRRSRLGRRPTWTVEVTATASAATLTLRRWSVASWRLLLFLLLWLLRGVFSAGRRRRRRRLGGHRQQTPRRPRSRLRRRTVPPAAACPSRRPRRGGYDGAGGAGGSYGSSSTTSCTCSTRPPRRRLVNLTRRYCRRTRAPFRLVVGGHQNDGTASAATVTAFPVRDGHRGILHHRRSFDHGRPVPAISDVW